MLTLLTKPSPDRLLLIAEAFRFGITVEEVNDITKFDQWFLRQIQELVEIERNLEIYGLPDNKEDCFKRVST